MDDDEIKVSEDGNIRIDAKGNWGDANRVSNIIGRFGGSRARPVSQDMSAAKTSASASSGAVKAAKEGSSSDDRYIIRDIKLISFVTFRIIVSSILKLIY